MKARQHRHHPQTLHDECDGHQHYAEVIIGGTADVRGESVLAEVIVLADCEQAQSVALHLTREPDVMAVGVMESVISLN